MNNNLKNLPLHLSIIMDGNSRWANENNYSRKSGHYKGYEVAFDIVEFCVESALKELTLFVLSRENITFRPKFELQYLSDILIEAVANNQAKLIKHEVKVRIVGDISVFSLDVQQALHSLVNSTKECKKMQLNLAINYSGQWHIKECLKSLNANANNLDKQIDSYMTKDISPCDLLIRTGKENRVSNFLLWHLSYSEIYFSNKFWPEFTKQDLIEILIWFGSRNRRFGGRLEKIDFNEFKI